MGLVLFGWKCSTLSVCCGPQYNIGYGLPGATAEQIEAAAKAAQVHNAVSGFSQGYETVVGERGVKVSGGEKQRIALYAHSCSGSGSGSGSLVP